MKTKKIFSLSVIAISALLIGSCKKKKEDPAPEPNGTLYLHMHTNIDTTEADSGMVTADANGRRFQLNIAQFYISGMKLKKTDGSWISVGIENGIILKAIDSEQYLIGSVPAGNYLSVGFDVGVDAANNVNSPSQYPVTSPLSSQNPSMWFGNTTEGYVFMNVHGLADTTASNSGSVNVPFSYQLGTGNLLKHVTMPDMAFSVVGNQAQIVHTVADYGKLLQGVSFKNHNSVTPFNDITTATQIAANIPLMFSYE